VSVRWTAQTLVPSPTLPSPVVHHWELLSKLAAEETLAGSRAVITDHSHRARGLSFFVLPGLIREVRTRHTRAGSACPPQVHYPYSSTLHPAPPCSHRCSPRRALNFLRRPFSSPPFRAPTTPCSTDHLRATARSASTHLRVPVSCIEPWVLSPSFYWRAEAELFWPLFSMFQLDPSTSRGSRPSHCTAFIRFLVCMHTVTPGVSIRAFRATPAVNSRTRDPPSSNLHPPVFAFTLRHSTCCTPRAPSDRRPVPSTDSCCLSVSAWSL
jgi:hypothetical protein